MKNQKLFITLFSAAILSIAHGAAGSTQAPVDNSIYAGLLEKHLRGGRVDYKGFKKDETRLDEYLQQISRVAPDQLDRSEQMALYINLYNAATIKLILTGSPDLKSIKDLGTLFQSPWKKKFIELNGQTISLDHIEHDILRPRFKDPRVHFAVNCASKSCPPLFPEPYTGIALEEQLSKAASDFINDPQSNYLDGNTLKVSRIFKWFNEDFNSNILSFFIKYAHTPLKEKLAQPNQPIEVQYLEYDWSLNR